jgi:hypothetical protein
MTTVLVRDDTFGEAALPPPESADFHVETAKGRSAADLDLAAHEATYDHFLAMAQVAVASIICHLLLLVIWGVEGHGFVALIGFLLTIAATAIGLVTDRGWRAVAPILALLALTSIVL